MSDSQLLDLAERRRWWREHGTLGRFDCPCCGYPTLGERGGYEICPICWWEDDNQDDPGADVVFGGPNGDYSLTEGRLNFAKYLCQYRISDSRIEDLLVEELLEWKRKLIRFYGKCMEEDFFDDNEFNLILSKIEKTYHKKRLP